MISKTTYHGETAYTDSIPLDMELHNPVALWILPVAHTLFFRLCFAFNPFRHSLWSLLQNFILQSADKNNQWSWSHLSWFTQAQNKAPSSILRDISHFEHLLFWKADYIHHDLKFHLFSQPGTKYMVHQATNSER